MVDVCTEAEHANILYASQIARFFISHETRI